MIRYLVLEDIAGRYSVGASVDQALATKLQNSGVALIPVDLDVLYSRNAVSGFFRRDCGDGVLLNPSTPARICPLMLYTVPNKSQLHWRARLDADKEMLKAVAAGTEQLSGQLRIAADTAQAQAVGGGFTAVGPNHIDIAKLGPADEKGGWVVGGVGAVSPLSEQFHGFVLYGAARRIRVRWVAISQTS